MNYTPKQREIMVAIRDYIQRTGMSPTLEEIGNEVGTHRVTVHQHLAGLTKKGAIQRLPQRSRSIVILDPDFLRPPAFVNLAEHIGHGGTFLDLKENGNAVALTCKCGDEILVERK